MKTIWKFILETTDTQRILIPSGSSILTVQSQNGEPRLWAEVNHDSPLENVIIETFRTGHPMDESKRDYIGTYQMNGGALVFHVYVNKEEP